MSGRPSPADRVPPAALVVAAVTSVQFGGALAKTLFDEVGPGGAVFMRTLFAALVLAAIWRPRLTGHSRRDLLLIVVFGLSLAGMNATFYASLDRIPLGIAVTFEFVGPLGVAVFGSRRPLDLVWVALAAAGILLLSDFGAADLDGARRGPRPDRRRLLGRLHPDRRPRRPGASRAAAASRSPCWSRCVPLTPLGIADGGSELLVGSVLATGFAVAMLSSAIPYTLELEALRRLPAGVFGVLMSLEPAAAAAAGFIVLGEDLQAREIVAILLVVAASAGAARGASVAPRDA